MNEKELKVILIGDSGVGKTSLINITTDLPYENYGGNISTLSAYYIQKDIEYNNTKYNLNMWGIV